MGAEAHRVSLATLAAMPERMGQVEMLRGHVMSAGQARDYVNLALRIRYADGFNCPINTDAVMSASITPGDSLENAWGLFNHVQRHLVAAPDQLVGVSATNRKSVARPVTRIDENLRVNVGLWNTMLQVTGIAKAANEAAKANPTVVVAKPEPVAAEPKAKAAAPKAKAKGKAAKIAKETAKA
jgi:hypothetical protein